MVSITFGLDFAENAIPFNLSLEFVTPMNKTGLIVAFFCVQLLAACAVQKPMVATGGSRADGTVKLSYEYGRFEQPRPDFSQGMRVAQARCAAWGYTGAEAFGGSTKLCNQPSGNGCARWVVTTEYQCIGTPPSSK